MIGVVDYQAGNITSVSNALAKIGVSHIVTSDRDRLASGCDGIILPGVGAAPGAMVSLEEEGLVDFLRSAKVPLLGICLGMQLLYELSEEGDTRCLGVIPGTVRKLDSQAVKVPHMGWNAVRLTSPSPLMEGVSQSEYFYFAHSYAADANGTATGVVDCGGGREVTAAVRKGNYYGVQFHPEKSAEPGLRVLKNFESLCTSFRR